MTAMILALFFSDAALNATKASDYATAGEQERESVEHHVEFKPANDPWHSRFEGGSHQRATSPAFFKRDVEDFRDFKLGPTCDADELPYAL